MQNLDTEQLFQNVTNFILKFLYFCFTTYLFGPLCINTFKIFLKFYDFKGSLFGKQFELRIKEIPQKLKSIFGQQLGSSPTSNEAEISTSNH